MTKARLETEFLKENYKAVIGFTILIVILAIIFFPIKDCEDNEECLNTQAALCKKAQGTIMQQGNTNYYSIMHKKENNCLLEMKILKVREDADQKTKDLLEGKQMVCSIPQETLQEVPLTDIDHISDFCTGPLKEALLQILVEKMYSVIVANLGQISLSIEESLNLTK